LIEFSLDSPADLLNQQADRFTLATIVFTSLVAGSSPLDLTINSLADNEANDLASTAQDSSVIVAAVPLPAPMWLFGSGLVWLWGKRKQQI